MKTVVLETVIRSLVPLFVVFALYMLFRGHDQPGGGFIAGLIAVIPLMIHAIAFSPEKTRATYRIKPLFLAASGLLLATVSGIVGLLKGSSFMAPLWPDMVIPMIGKMGTPLLFDIGVFLVVGGFVLKVTFLFKENQA